MEPGLHARVTDATATVVISNPAKRNAMTHEMWRALPPLLTRLAADPEVRCLVLSGDGPTFCAGADIGTLLDDGADARKLAATAEEALAAFPKPTLAAVRGHCVGGGCRLAVACDLRLAEEGALFDVTPARLGVVYPAASTRRLVALAGASTAKYLLFTGELIDCAHALRRGLVDEVAAPGRLTARVSDLTAILSARSQLTQVAAKECADRPADPPGLAGWEAAARKSGETAEGVAAFLERRAPRFPWRL